jgi:thiol:disulfide interchange protein DsbC
MKAKSRSLCVLAVLFAMIAGTCLAADTQSDPAAAPAAIRKTLESRFPGTKVLDVQPGPVPGLYEVYVGSKIYYSDATGEHLIAGSIIDTRTKTDLTEQRLEERGTIDFKSLPFDKAIKVVRGTGARQLAAFEDPDCPFCQKLERELASIKDTTVYVFLFPIDQLHPQATAHAHAIWCAPDRAGAWTGWLTQKKAPPAASCTKDPIGDVAKLGDKLYIEATPTLFFTDGRRVTGAIGSDEIEKLLVASSGHPATPAGEPAPPAKGAAGR